MTDSPNSFSLRRQSNGGFALVVVLAVLVLVVALAIAFLNRATTERSAAAGFSSLVSARQLTDSVVGLVQSQINLATLQGRDVAWASQPGMIRTYDTAGNLKEAFKLYSGPQMITRATLDVAAEATKTAAWTTDTARWTDLNAPVIVPVDGIDKKIYPILDPAAVDTEASETAASEGAIDQFTISSAAPTTPDQEAPMPVEWLYVLQDGTFQTPGGSGDVASVPSATPANPIVGRVAFWTDDETAKVNINTASEGAFWDTPRVQSAYDRDLAAYQPAKNEFQRYPGHPATTSLSSALPVKSPALTFDNIYSIAPRVRKGGSNVQSSDGKVTPGAIKIANVSGNFALDGDRLYASVDELLFQPDRSSQELTKTDLESAKFFLTATSRAPETNLFNLPRVAMWPIHEQTGSAYRNATDDLLAFVATLDGQPYYFMRKDRRSSTADYGTIARNQALFAYLQNLSDRQIPGFGGSFAAKYPADRDQILAEMFDYVRMTNLRDTTVNQPYGGSAWTERGSIYTEKGNGQVVPIRIPSSGGGPTEARGLGRFPIVSEASLMFVGVGKHDGGTTPTRVDSSQRQAIGTAGAPAFAGYDNTGQPSNTTQVLGIFVLQFFVPAMGWSDYNPDFTVEIEGLDQFRLGGTGLAAETMRMPSRGSVWVSNSDLFHGRLVGGTVDWRSMVTDRNLGASGAPGGLSESKTLSYDETDESRFPFFSKIFDIPNKDGDRMNFEGGAITIRIYAGNGEKPGATDPSRLVQTIELTIPDGTFPVPGLSPEYGRLVGTEERQNGRTGSPPFDRFDTGPVDVSLRQVFEEDVVQSVVLAGGDPRIAAGANVPATAYEPHKNWGSTSHFAHGLVSGLAYRPFAGRTSGRLVQGLDYKADGVPLAPANLDGAFAGGTGSTVPGDWDTGLALYSDGPYINKPDEGNVAAVFDEVPYFSGSEQFKSVPATFSTPNRQIPSAGMFGSLPTGVNTARPWQTLLFRPDPSGLHPGAKGRRGDGSALTTAPADHLWMDLFWMPIVEPYPISEPMSTAGKVNMNYQIMPFTYINRDSGLRAVLKTEQIVTLEDADAQRYKTLGTGNMMTATGTKPNNPRESLNLSATNGTLRQFQERFAAGDIFRSATEICDIFLVPQSENWTSDNQGEAFWNNYLLTGDNLRERPYANIYPRLTTKSNTYTVHFKVQALKNPAGAAAGQWDETSGVVEAEYRGSATIERYVDLDSVDVDFATDTTRTLNEFYKWRILANRQFAP